MMNNAHRQITERLLPNQPVTLNLGLKSGTGRPHSFNLTFGQRVAMYSRDLRELLEPGWHASVSIAKTEDDEDTLIVAGIFVPNINQTELFWDMLKRNQQDCAAIYYLALEYGVLVGEFDHTYGEFDITLFKQLEYTHD